MDGLKIELYLWTESFRMGGVKIKLCVNLELEVGKESGIQKKFKMIIFKSILKTVKWCIWWLSDSYGTSQDIYLLSFKFMKIMLQ